MDNKELVIVLGRNYATALSIVRSLGAAGYTVDLVASSRHQGASAIAACSKYVRSAVEIIHKKVKEGQGQAAEQLIEELLKHKEQDGVKPVLFPTDDYTASVVDLNRSKLEPYFLMPSVVDGENGSMVHLMDKTVQAEMARKAGLCVPREWIFDLNKEIEIPEDMVFPCFCKPIESVTGYKSEMAACENEEAFLKHMGKLRRNFANRSILVQEYLHIDREIDLSGVCLDQQVIIPAIIEKTHVAQHEKGVTLAGRVVPFEKLGDIQEKIIQLLKQFRYVGMFDMELNIVGDQIYFNEVNLRSGGPNYSYFKSGVNLPALFVKEVLGQKHSAQEEKVSEYGKTFIYEKVAWEDYAHGFMTKSELKETIQKADITLLYNEDDPAPQKMFIKSMRQAQGKRKMRELQRELNLYKRKIKRFKRLSKRKFRRKVRQVKYRIKRKIRQFKRTVRQFKRKVRRFKRKVRLFKHEAKRSIRVFAIRTMKYVLQLPQIYKKNRRDPASEKPRVLISGRNYASNLCLAKSVGQAGYDVEILHIYQKLPKSKPYMPALCVDAYSKYIKAYHICVTNRESKTLVKRLKRLADPNRKMLLIPADDLVSSIADEYYDVLKNYYMIPNVDERQGAIGLLMDKDIQTKLAMEAGLPVINSCVIRTENKQFEIPDTINYPCFIKPNVSKNSSKSQMKKCDTREDLFKTLKQRAAKKDIEMKVEDFVDIRKEYAILGLSTKDGVIAPGFFGTEVGGHGDRRGVAMVGKVLATSEQGELIDNVIKFVKSLNYEGLFDVDLIETTDGKIYFVELNLRYGASGYAITKSGANLPGMFADYMLMNKPIDLDCKIDRPGRTFISERVMLGEYNDRFLTADEMKAWMENVDIHFIYEKEDPKAYKCFKRMVAITSLEKLVGKHKIEDGARFVLK